MPRDINGVYTLPAPMPVQPRTIPVTNVFNTVLADVKDALNNIPGDALVDQPVFIGPKMSLKGDDLSYLEFLDASDVRKGYVGDGAGSGAEAILLAADIGRIRLFPSAADPVVLLDRGQLQFPSTQNPSTDPNTLDDYEEGTWTPSITFATPGDQSVVYNTTTSPRTGTYQKVGNTVHYQFRLDTTTFTHTTASGILLITGLPFTPKTLGYGGQASGWVGAALINGLTHPTQSFFPFLSVQDGVANFFLGVCTANPGTNATNVTGPTVHTSGVNVIIMGTGSYQV